MKRLFFVALLISFVSSAFAQLPSVSLKDINGKSVNTAELNNGGSEGYESGESSVYGEKVTLNLVIEPEKVESLLFYWNADWGNDDLPGWDEEEHEPVLYEVKIRK